MYFVFVILASEPDGDYAIMTTIFTKDQVVTFPHYAHLCLAGVYDTEPEAKDADRHLRRRVKEQLDSQNPIQLEEIEGMHFVWRKDLVDPTDSETARSYYEATPTNIQHAFKPGEKFCVLLATPHADEAQELVDKFTKEEIPSDPPARWSMVEN